MTITITPEEKHMVSRTDRSWKKCHSIFTDDFIDAPWSFL